MDSKHVKGDSSEARVLFELLSRGCDVLEPSTDNLRYDLAIDFQGELIRIQVKTARDKDGVVVFDTSSTNYEKGSWEANDYTGEADYIFAYCYEREEIYIVDVSEAPKKDMTLRYEEAGKPNPRINWISDYKIENISERFKWL